MEKKKILGLATIFILGMSFGIIAIPKIILVFPQYHYLHEHNTWIINTGGVDGEINLKHDLACTVEQWRDGILIYSFGDTEVMTDIGKNFTAMKLSGDTDWTTTDFAENVTYLGFGDQGSLSASSTSLPTEKTRFDVSANFTYIDVGKWNYTGYWYPDASSTTDCCGMYWKSTGENLYCYDTFGEISYTDADTIISKWQFTITYS